MNIELFNTGCIIMTIGMGVVFFFLVLMIGAMQLCTKIIQIFNKYFPEEIKETQSKNKKQKKQQDDTEIAIAIAAAIQRSGL